MSGRQQNTARKPFQSRYTEAWKMQAGVCQRIERYGRFVRYAEHDKVARVGYPLLCVKDAPYLNPNPLKQKGKKSYEIDSFITITLDIDSELTVDELQSALPNLPVNFAVGRPSPVLGLLVRPHLIIHLKWPVRRFPETPMEIADKQKFDRIVDEIATRLVAAGHFVDAVNMTNVKNPDYERWDTYTDPQAREWTLKELLQALDISGRKSPDLAPIASNVVHLAEVRWRGWKTAVRGLQLDLQDDASRNKQTFLHVREAICAQFKNGMSEQVIQQICLEAADEINATFEVPLKSGEIKSICRSITKYMNAKGFERKPPQKERNRGVARDLMAGAYEDRHRQSRGSRYTHAKKVLNSIERVRTARIELGQDASKAAVARHLGIKRDTVAKYWEVEDASTFKAVALADKLRQQDLIMFDDFVKYRLPEITREGGAHFGVSEKRRLDEEIEPDAAYERWLGLLEPAERATLAARDEYLLAAVALHTADSSQQIRASVVN